MEQVVLLDESGVAIGTADKLSVHHASTPLHLAFSSYLFDGAGRLLLTRRALHKKTWPGAWTNSCCGHPAPGEAAAPAVRRRLVEELGLEDVDLDLVLPAFRYRAEMENGVVENEMCPVFRGLVTGEPHPNPDEVDAVEWVPWAEFAPAVLAGARPVSPWCVLQVAELWELGPDPLAWPTASASALPPAAAPA
ncbi:isopentenyl-diphosphate Delta-isomerase [Saccharothrix yanglingensis]|uniref:Isopentenyl-diphosphate Delta-isomerase n=1 Tax=Saccharothrix yanglingensis TaxID=659496 RepID=A0ABU0X6C6_9PSEU|nr:isopentenyl-diphosphate Delta-isomerase [Saccharothrix yanglingensis]MDQ2587678.1 isopentenyl-diphosphate delta-isomerase [Saccharothrix yanglingensis]